MPKTVYSFSHKGVPMTAEEMLNVVKAEMAAGKSQPTALLNQIANAIGGAGTSKQKSLSADLQKLNKATVLDTTGAPKGLTQYSAPGSTGGSGYVSGTDLQSSIINDLQKAQDDARAANEKRYQEILAGYGTRRADVLAGLEGMGETARQSIYDTYAQQSEAAKQDLISRGLTGTTVAPAIQRGYLSDRMKQEGALDESLRAQRASTVGQLDKEKLDFMERRTDAYPDVGMYLDVLQRLGTQEAPMPSQTKAYSWSSGPTRTTTAPTQTTTSRIGSTTQLKVPGYTPQPKAPVTTTKAPVTQSSTVRPASTGQAKGYVIAPSSPGSSVLNKYVAGSGGFVDTGAAYAPYKNYASNVKNDPYADIPLFAGLF